MEVRSVSYTHLEYSMELILNTKEGKGSMTFFSLFPGLSLAYIFINSPTWTAPDLRSDSSITKGPLLLNYCVTGRCEMILNNKNFVYIKDRELSLTECFLSLIHISGYNSGAASEKIDWTQYFSAFRWREAEDCLCRGFYYETGYFCPGRTLF